MIHLLFEILMMVHRCSIYSDVFTSVYVYVHVGEIEFKINFVLMTTEADLR